ncbi:fatty acid desaturase [Oscillatoria sp. FACHB-1407]|uniref:fatty acid desaturase n=1 Tax=Oscillatoria sp. FACHB-1407 TaxID=2692847 RepID=UPI0016896BA7|nr:fatty acid desaturase [Oscillatoria sp. FACHB-1407]MBD2463543.1 fatty acid desaturase [Oscillatoria sp. FACHB-1407]
MSSVSSDLAFRMGQRSYGMSGLALSYVLIGYVVSIVCISSRSWFANALGVFLLIHTLIWAAYFVHEFIHGTVFRQPRMNAWFGNLMLFLTGSCYCHFRDLARNHLAHHKNRADFSAFSIADFLKSLPKPLTQLIVALEWMYFPAVNLILRWLCIMAPFLGQARRDERSRTLGLLALRGSFFIALGLYSWRSLLLYGFAYICFINILRFMDCFQHTYAVFQLGQSLPQYSLEYEESNTYSNLMPDRWRWLNLLFLNFGYHNAHHRVIHCPWYLLPQLDAELYPSDYRQHITLDRFVKNYHQFRIHRLFNNGGTVIDSEQGLDLDSFVGAVGVSFLILREPLEWLNLTVSTAQPT